MREELNNPDFNRVEFDTVTKDAGTNSFMITPSQWIQKLNGIGLTVSAGKYNSGIYAHQDIAFEFASWVSAEFKLYLIQLRVLKEIDTTRLLGGKDAR